MVLIHSHQPLSSVLPRLRVMSPHFLGPGIFLMIGTPPGVTSSCSMTLISIESPLTSLNWASVMPSTSIWKLYAPRASLGSTLGSFHSTPVTTCRPRGPDHHRRTGTGGRQGTPPACPGPT